MNIPSPETLRPLFEAALAIMAPNDPARECLTASANIRASGQSTFSVYFYEYLTEQRREAWGSGPTAEEALEDFRDKYTPPHTKEYQISLLKAQIAELEGVEDAKV